MSEYVSQARCLIGEAHDQWEPGSDIEQSFLVEAQVNASLAVAEGLAGIADELHIANLTALTGAIPAYTPAVDTKVREVLARYLEGAGQ